MKIQKIINTLAFKSIREDRNTTEQLKQENDYALTENNQKRISKAIENLSEHSGAKNVKFLLNVAENLKYSTNIQNDAKPRNDWKLQLKNAAEKSLSMSDPITKEKLSSEIHRVFYAPKALTEDEKQILQSKENILNNIDKSELENEKNTNIKNIEKNLNHFIISSEIPLHQKKYILNRFEYLLSPEYNINPQLANKKTVVLAEMLNDLVVTTGDSKIPNTKAINQKQHGMCAAISIARKLMSYEYKTDFVDSIMSELDDSDKIMVYDIAHLGEKKKIPVQKNDIDFIDAMNKGYRIIDASTTQWMHIADMFGVDNKSELVYTAFDGNHFGTFTDTHYNKPLEDSNLHAKQSFYQALLKAKENIDTARLYKAEAQEKQTLNRNNFNSDIETISSLHSQIAKNLKSSNIDLSLNETHKIVSDLLRLEKGYSADIDKANSNLKNYSFIHNEENIIKDRKIKSFLQNEYKIELSDKAISDIRDLIIMSNSITNSISPSSSLAKKVSYDRKLFDAASAYRTSMLFSITDNDLKTDMMVHYNIVDSEKFTSDSIARFIDKVNNGDSRYINYFSKTYGVPANKKNVAKILKDLKAGYDYNTTKALDDMYGAIGAGNRIQAALGQLRYLKDSIQNGDKTNLRTLSVTMDLPRNKTRILGELEKFEKILSNKPTEDEYSMIINKLGVKNRFEEFAEAYRTVANAIKNPDSENNQKIINSMKLANNLSEEAPLQELEPIMVELAHLFNGMLENLQNVRNSLQVLDEKGLYIDSASPNFELIKKMERDGKIIPATELLRLQVRYDAIDKIRSQDEFSSRQGKISNPELYKYTKAEKETLKKIEKSLNQMASDTNKELIGIYKEIKTPLEEHARKIGVNMGMFWSMPEASSGLYSFQQSKILQQLTDKPYQILEDFDKAIDIIKNSPHSGISGTSVFHTKSGGHAQYISEITENNGREILYHDNSWGASEHENTWVDSEGLLRTDYSDDRGGELGYITDSRFRNGNYISNLLEKTGDFRPEKIHSKNIKKLKRENEGYKFPLLRDIVVPGISNEADNVAASIKDNIFLSDTRFLYDFETKLSKMTVDEIRAAKEKCETAGRTYKKELDAIEKRLETTPFNNGIQTKADYDSLANDDPLKVAFEKVAFNRSYNFISLWKELAEVNTVEEVNKFREAQRVVARENFEYAFAKSPEILYAYALNKTKSNVHTILNNALESNNIKIDGEKKLNIVRNCAVYEPEEISKFDGSLKHTIDFMVNKILKNFDANIPQTEDSLKAKEEIRKNLTKDLAKGLYFSKKDLLKDTELNNAIRKYIDRKYQPESDEEFINIYNRLQNMTLEEFRKETSDATDADMAFKNITGYDILKQYKASNENIQSEIANVVYQKHIIKDIPISKTTPHFQYKKLQKKPRGAYYTSGKTYEDLYRSFNYSLQSLTFDKLFNKYKDNNYRKYGVMPAYPKIDIFDDEFIDKEIEILDSSINAFSENIQSRKLNLQVYSTTDRVDNFLNKIPDNKALTQLQTRLLNNIIGEFITDNYNDTGLEASVNSAQKMLELPAHSTAKEYKEVFTNWKKQVNAIRQLNPEEKLITQIQADVKKLKNDIQLVVNADIPPKYRSKIIEKVNIFVNEVLKEAKTSYDIHANSRILKQKLLTYANPKTTAEDIETFYGTMDLQIAQIKKIKQAYFNNKNVLEKQNQKTIEAMLAFMENSVSDEIIEQFPDFIMETYRNNNGFNAEEFAKEVSNFTNIPISELVNDEKFQKLSSRILKYNKTYQTDNNYKASLKRNSQKLEDIINKFIEKRIQPEYQRSVSTILPKYAKQELLGIGKGKEFSLEKWVDFKYALTQDFKKYHYWRHPQELLDRYTELCAKDGDIAKAAEAKDDIAVERLETERRFARKGLKDALSFAELIEMQEILINSASELGNPALATKKFKNYDTDFIDDKTGTRLSLADSTIMDFMARKLLHTRSDETAIMFIEKLGLTDQFMEKEDKLLDVKKTKVKINHLASILKTVNKQTKALEEEVKKFETDDMTLEEFCDEIDKSKATIIEKTKKLPRQKTVKNILETFDSIKVLVGANPDLPKDIILQQAIRDLRNDISTQTNEDISSVQADLNEINTIYKLISKLNIPEYRIAHQYKESFYKKFEEIENYRNKVLQKVMQDSEAIEIRTSMSE